MKHKPLIIATHGLMNQPKDIANAYKQILEPKTDNEVVFFRWDDMLNEGWTARVGGSLEEATLLLPSPWNMIAYPFVDIAGEFAGDYFAYAGQREKTFVKLINLIRSIDPNNERPLILIGHSMGAILFYEFIVWLQNFRKNRKPMLNVHTLITLGTPMDRKPVRGNVEEYVKGIRRPNIQFWKNYYNSGDLITCWTPWRTGDIEHFDPDEQEKNRGNHNALKYLAHIDPKNLNI